MFDPWQDAWTQVLVGAVCAAAATVVWSETSVAAWHVRHANVAVFPGAWQVGHPCSASVLCSAVALVP
jgi:hypothetical protein